MTLWGKHKDPREVRIPVEGADAGNDVAIEYLERFSADDDLPADETRSLRRQLLVYDLVKLSCVLERESEERDQLYK